MSPTTASDPRPVSIFAVDAPLSEVVSDIAYQIGVSAIVDADLREAVVSVEFRSIDAAEAFRRVARSASAYYAEADGVVTISAAPPPPSVVLSLPVEFDDAGELAELLSLIAGETASVSSLGSEVVVAGDAESVARVAAAVEDVASRPDGWMLQVLVFRTTQALGVQIGVAPSVGASLGGEFGVGVGDSLLGTSGSVEAAASVSLLAQAAQDGSDAELASVGSLFILEGRSASLQQGQVVPVRRRRTSAEGNVETVGFDQIQTGFTMQAEARRVGERVLLELTPRLSSVVGFVEDAPITDEQSVTATAVVSSGEWIILSGLDSWRDSVSSSGLPGLPGSLLWESETRTSERSSVIVCVRAVRVFASGG